MTFIVRPAAPEDIHAIEELMRLSMAGLGVRYYDAQQVSSAVLYIAVVDRQLIDDGTYFVVTDDDRIVACGGWSWRKKLFTGTDAQAATEGKLDPAADAARIRAMFVHPHYARRGLGRMILDASERAARDSGFTRFELMATLPGLPMYEACGYESVEEATIELPDGVRLAGVRMSRHVK